MNGKGAKAAKKNNQSAVRLSTSALNLFVLIL